MSVADCRVASEGLKKKAKKQNKKQTNKMPRKKTVKSLKRCCLKRIATSFEKHWFLEFTQHFDELPRLLYVIGPFDHWSKFC